MQLINAAESNGVLEEGISIWELNALQSCGTSTLPTEEGHLISIFSFSLGSTVENQKNVQSLLRLIGVTLEVFQAAGRHIGPVLI
ncbi:hypothetical protein NPIL_623251 [Nephila pilipes]|uniref:Uncharacterized protein n=1 Tax=Nephila pilipes TaxID=299642 RepID=A0A8X6Q808_NEPPI|nr:hypothetical protein NPIL_623251 [Nephila pilipes]